MAPKKHQESTFRGGWVRMTPAEAQAFSAESKQIIKDKVDQVIDRYMKPSLPERQSGKAAFGVIQDVYTKWHGQSLILIAKRHGGRMLNQQVEDFETKSGRITLIGVDRFDVSYFRHTERWWTIHHDCSLKTALEYFREPSPLWPW
jgi:hypothetical protein